MGSLTPNGTAFSARENVSHEPAVEKPTMTATTIESASPSRPTRRAAMGFIGSTTSTPSTGRYLGASRRAMATLPYSMPKNTTAKTTPTMTPVTIRVQKTVRNATSPNQSQST